MKLALQLMKEESSQEPFCKKVWQAGGFKIEVEPQKMVWLTNDSILVADAEPVLRCYSCGYSGNDFTVADLEKAIAEAKSYAEVMRIAIKQAIAQLVELEIGR